MATVTPVKFMSEGTDDFLEFKIGGRTHPASNHSYDRRWLLAGIHLQVGDFTGQVSANVTDNELHRFYTDLKTFYQTLNGQISFQPYESWFEFVFDVNKLGQVTFSGYVTDGLYQGNKLLFRIALDQTFLKDSLKQLESVCKSYPIATDE